MKSMLSRLRTERQWRSATGLSAEQFGILCGYFLETYLSVYGSALSSRHVDMPEEYVFSDERELLFFTLFSLKSGLNYDLLGLTCGMDSSTAHRNQHMGLRLLETTFSAMGVLPKRSFDSVEDWQAYFDTATDLCIDVSEQRIQRPQNEETQKINYSGKKSPYSKILKRLHEAKIHSLY